MRVLIAGSSGFLGGNLAAHLTATGNKVTRLVRRPTRKPGEIQWDPAKGQLEPHVLSTVDAVVNLCGAGVEDHRWNDSFRRVLRDSRVMPSATLARAIADARARPAVLLNASGVGYYGNTGDTPVDEGSPSGDGFLARLCREWEAATEPAAEAGVRVVRLRTGLPLDRTAGLLRPLALATRLGVGGRLGNGRQYWPWLSLLDWVRAVMFLMERDDISGPVNVSGPEPVTNAAFVRELGRLLHRPTVLPVPYVALRIALGEFAGEAVVSQRVLPRVLTRAGFEYQHPDLTAALTWAIRHPR